MVFYWCCGLFGCIVAGLLVCRFVLGSSGDALLFGFALVVGVYVCFVLVGGTYVLVYLCLLFCF